MVNENTVELSIISIDTDDDYTNESFNSLDFPSSDYNAIAYIGYDNEPIFNGYDIIWNVFMILTFIISLLFFIVVITIILIKNLNCK